MALREGLTYCLSSFLQSKKSEYESPTKGRPGEKEARPTKKSPAYEAGLFIWWSRRDLNPRPAKVFLNFLHVYSNSIFEQCQALEKLTQRLIL